MNRRLFGALLAASAVSLALPSAYAAPQDHDHGHGHDDDDHGHGHGKDKDHDHDDHHYEEHHEEHGHDRHWDQHERYYHDEDRVYLTRYYDGPRNLPPGLRKKYVRYGTLPPGWEKRFRPMPPQVIVQLPPVPVGYQRGYCDGYAVIIDPRTRIIYDAVDIVGALSGH